mmetsp:Transcript_32063/g.99032  ORF Transcript_32063/g.99032 Transcript_32063/m.99032 type:complete len:104 (+) Transcript_32063:1673-1984(+)
MALDEISQCGLAAGDAMIWCIRALSQCHHVRVLRAVAHATAAIAYNSLANKARFAQLGAISALLSVVSRFGVGSLGFTEEHAPVGVITGCVHPLIIPSKPPHL